MEEQVVVIYAGVNGFLDPLPVERVKAFENGLLTHIRARHGEILDAIRTSRDLTDETAAKLKSAVESFAKSFA
jgi:F-type H+-transporting ATPase subunit alpha